MSKPDANEYAALISSWFDELAPQIDAFKRQFPSDMLGFLKYLFAIHMMQSAVCDDLEIEPGKYEDFIRTLTAMWYAAGRPNVFAIAKGRLVTNLEEFKGGRPN